MDEAWLSGQLVVRPPGSQLISSELTAERKCKELTDSPGACLGGEAFHAGGETLYEEQTSVSKGGWQQLPPPSSFRRLSSHPEVETASSLESRDLLLPTESSSEALSSRPGPEKPPPLLLLLARQPEAPLHRLVHSLHFSRSDPSSLSSPWPLVSQPLKLTNLSPCRRSQTQTLRKQTPSPGHPADALLSMLPVSAFAGPEGLPATASAGAPGAVGTPPTHVS